MIVIRVHELTLQQRTCAADLCASPSQRSRGSGPSALVTEDSSTSELVSFKTNSLRELTRALQDFAIENCLGFGGGAIRKRKRKLDRMEFVKLNDAERIHIRLKSRPVAAGSARARHKRESESESLCSNSAEKDESSRVWRCRNRESRTVPSLSYEKKNCSTALQLAMNKTMWGIAPLSRSIGNKLHDRSTEQKAKQLSSGRTQAIERSFPYSRWNCGLHRDRGSAS